MIFSMDFQTFTLPNGIRIIHQHAESPVHYCGFTINAGTRDELAGEEGMAHFVEHMLFKGTTHRKSRHIIDRLESVGGGLNAYTTKEETFVYATVPSQFVQRSMELLADVVFCSTFPENEIEKETDVILEEIQLYNDSPSELIYDDIEEMVFAGSPLGRAILGNEESLSKFTSADAQKFVKRCHNTTEMLFFSMGKTDFGKIVRWAEKFFAVPRSERQFVRQKPNFYVPKTVVKSKETCQTHCILGCRAYGMDDDNQAALFLLSNILGGPNLSSRLNMIVRERYGLVYTIEASAIPYTDSGIFTIYFGCEHNRINKCIKLITKELNNFAQTAIDSRKLAIAKRQLAGQLLIEAQNDENSVLSMAKYFLHKNEVLTLNQSIEKIETITAEQLQTIANQLFAQENLSKLIYE